MRVNQAQSGNSRRTARSIGCTGLLIESILADFTMRVAGGAQFVAGSVSSISRESSAGSASRIPSSLRWVAACPRA